MPIHERSDFYDVAGFKAGKSTLMPVEVEEVGDVAGKSLLHLQCHFGLDTMSWARLGAKATGVDFSEPAIALARSLSDELAIDVRFVHSNVYDLPENLEGRFDIVFTSYGAVNWLPDLAGWARVVSHFLKPGGTFYVIDGHPFTWGLDDENPDDIIIRYPYFRSDEPLKFEADGKGSYANETAVVTTATREWAHTMGDILNFLISAGLQIEFLHEFPFVCWEALPMMQKGEDGWWRLPEGRESLPFLFSVRASNRE
ncbi:MAG: class I SAM-dependent methyltransferase [Chloroflexi bacterium]|nr:class I SAM-dependent methyltransferase [Chloroflexota bacterium]